MVTKWNNEYWLLLMQLYLRKPMGTKPLYSRGMVDLALELHLSPQYLYRKMMQLRRLDTPVSNGYGTPMPTIPMN